MKMDKKSVLILLLAAGLVCSASVNAYDRITGSRVDYKIYINGQLKEFSSSPVVFEDKTYLPVRAFAETLGLDVVWNEADKTIHISGDLAMAEAFNQLDKEELAAVLPFKSISAGDSLQDVFEKVGEVPDRGSGIMMFQYHISEKVEITIGSHDGDSVWYVRLTVNGKSFTLTKE